MSCLRCGKPMFAAVAYRPKESFLRCIDFKDGFLAVAVAYLLEKRKIRYEYSVKGPQEKDFICEGKTGRTLLECKMHRTDTSERATHETLKQDIAELLEHSKSPLADGERVVSAVLICNYTIDIVRKLAEPLLDSTKGKGTPSLSVISYQQVQDLLKELG